MANVVSLKAQADDAVIRAEIAATSSRTAKERLAACAARMETSRARLAREKQRATSVASSIFPSGPGGVTMIKSLTPATLAGIAVIRATEGKAPLPRGT